MKLIRSLILCNIFPIMVACNTVNSVVPVPNGRPGSPGFQQVVTNGWLNYKANVTDVHEDIVNGDQKRVQVSVFSNQSSAQSFSYRFEWLTPGGMHVDSIGDSWQTQRIMPQETIILNSIAPNSTASTWRLQLSDTNLPLSQ
jgi:uncharacterized protein YcfL